MVFNATLWQSDLLVEETEVPGENHQPAAGHWQTLSHNVILSTPRLSVQLQDLPISWNKEDKNKSTTAYLIVRHKNVSLKLEKINVDIKITLSQNF